MFAMSAPASSSSVCRFWSQQGHCFYGADCKYQHIDKQDASHRSHEHAHNNSATSSVTTAIVSHRSSVGATSDSGGDEAHQSPSPSFHFSDGAWLGSSGACVRSLFVNDSTLHRLLMARAIETERLDVTAPEFAVLPESLDFARYHDITPMQPDTLSSGMMTALALSSRSPARPRVSLYKSRSAIDGKCYCIRRYHPQRAREEECEREIEPWIRFQRAHSMFETDADTSTDSDEFTGHAGIIALRRFVHATEFGDGGALCLVYDFYPGAVSLASAHCPSPVPLPESLLWRYASAVLVAVHATHEAGLALGEALTLDRILLVAPGRIKLNCAGARDLLGESRSAPPMSFVEDLHRVGLALLALATADQLDQQWQMARVTEPRELVRAALRVTAARYSQEFMSLLTYCLSLTNQRGRNDQRPTAANALSLSSVHLARSHALMESLLDACERDLTLESTNGRLVRLMVKLGVAANRSSGAWSDAGDHYLAQVFQHTLFDPKQGLDLARIVSTLNRLDVGSGERCLMANDDGDTAIIASFADVKRAVAQIVTQCEAGQQQHQHYQ